MAEHPYFTRSKDSKDSFPNQSLSKGMGKKTKKSVDISLTEFTVMDPVIVEQNKLIAQLRQQIDEMKTEIQETREKLNLAIATNVLVSGDEKPPLYVSPLNPTPELAPNNPIIIHTPKAYNNHLTTTNQHHASSSHQVLPLPQNLNGHNYHTFPPTLKTPTQSIQNSPDAQSISSKAIFHIPMLSKSYLPLTTYFESNQHKEKAEYIKRVGRVSISHLAGKSNQFIDLEPKA